MFTRRFPRAAAALRRHQEKLRAAGSDAGYSVTEWVFITAAGGTLALLIYAAINGKVAEKIATIAGF